MANCLFSICAHWINPLRLSVSVPLDQESRLFVCRYVSFHSSSTKGTHHKNRKKSKAAQNLVQNLHLHFRIQNCQRTLSWYEKQLRPLRLRRHLASNPAQGPSQSL